MWKLENLGGFVYSFPLLSSPPRATSFERENVKKKLPYLFLNFFGKCMWTAAWSSKSCTFSHFMFWMHSRSHSDLAIMSEWTSESQTASSPYCPFASFRPFPHGYLVSDHFVQWGGHRKLSLAANARGQSQVFCSLRTLPSGRNHWSLQWPDFLNDKTISGLRCRLCQYVDSVICYECPAGEFSDESYAHWPDDCLFFFVANLCAQLTVLLNLFQVLDDKVAITSFQVYPCWPWPDPGFWPSWLARIFFHSPYLCMFVRYLCEYVCCGAAWFLFVPSCTC